MTGMLPPSVVERVRLVADALNDAKIPYALGGAIALNYWAEPRATRDIDVNIFLSEDMGARILDVLAAAGVPVDRTRDVARVLRDAQVRIPWDDIPLDLFFTSVPFLEEAAARRVMVPFAGQRLPILTAEDVMICKALFNREKDWFDIRMLLLMQGARLDDAYVRRWLHEMLGIDDERVTHFESLFMQTRID